MINISKTPRVNPKNVALPRKVYATVQIDKSYSLDDFARHIASHGSNYGRADISAVLILAVDCMRELILSGAQVNLGDLGTFKPSIRVKGADTAEEFSVSNIKKVKALWSPGKRFNAMRDDAQFRFVPSRKVQAAVLAAQNANEANVTVDLPTTEAQPSTGNDTQMVTLTCTAGAGGSVSPTTQTVAVGTSVTFTATPDSGKQVDKWSNNSTGNTLTVTATEDATYSVSFKNVSNGGGGGDLG